METMFKARSGLAVAIALAAVTGSASASVFQFDTTGTGVAVTNTFTADSIVLTALGTSTVTLTDGGAVPNGIIDIDPNGLIGGLVTDDTFVETGLVQFVNFRLGGGSVLPGTSGVDVNYQLFAVYDGVNGGPLVGKEAIDAGGNAVVQFGNATNARIYLDYGALNNAFDLGNSTLIANLTLDPSTVSNCVLPGLGTAQGTCVLDFNMSTPINTVFTVAGVDTEGAEFRVDINVDQVTPPFSPNFPAPGGQQVRRIDHDGSARITAVPEPATLALMGLGLLGLGASVRRRHK